MIQHWLSKAINKLTGIGITEDLPYIEKVKIRILNQANWVSFIGALALILQSFYLQRGDIYLDLIVMSIFIFPLIFNALKNYIAARLVATIVFPSFILILAITYGPKSSIEFIYFAVILLALIVYETWWARILNILVVVMIFSFTFYYWEHYPSLFPMSPSLLNDGIIFSGVTLTIASIVLNFYTEHKLNYKQQLNYNTTLAERNEKLEHYIDQNESKNQLIQIVAHDLKSPAAAFLNLTQKMSYLIRHEEPQRLIEISEHMEQSGTNFFYTLDNLLNWVISQQDGIKAAKEYISLNDLIDEIKQDMIFISKAKTLKISSLISEETTLFSDRNMMKIMLTNILHNAIKFSPTSEKIIITYESNEDYDNISITDFGQGMKKEIRELLSHQEIYYSSTGTQNERGYGLGLKICYRLVAFLNGNILINSGEGEGCQFTIRIPKERGPAPSNNRNTSAKNAERKSDR